MTPLTVTFEAKVRRLTQPLPQPAGKFGTQSCRRALAPENLFLRKQLALFQKRKVKPREQRHERSHLVLDFRRVRVPPAVKNEFQLFGQLERLWGQNQKLAGRTETIGP